ncbi:MAG: hypothetical protein QOD00_1848 [Blastocatellia bacterium]|jgi:hypothetical protein|nr:hypothetical protein [Blastocatellia bacterium]
MMKSVDAGRRLALAAAWCAALLTLMLLLEGCGGSLYKVKPVVAGPIKETGKVAEAGGLSLRAVPLLADEESQELFESNLPLAGLLPVRVEITNTSGAPILLKRMRFRLSDEAGRKWQERNAKQVVSRILKADQVTLYNPHARASFAEAFSRHALDTATPLAASERRQGLIFFQTPKKEPVESPRALVLSIEGLEQPLSLRLN